MTYEVAVRKVVQYGELQALALAAGYVGVGTDLGSGMMWFDFEAAAAAAPPVRTEYPGPTGQGYVDGDGYTTVGTAPAHLLREYRPRPTGIALRRYTPEPFVSGSNHPAGVGPEGQFAGELRGVALVPGRARVFAVDRVGEKLWTAKQAEPVAFAPVADFAPPAGAHLTAVAALGREWLLVAAGAEVLAYAVAADGTLALRWRLAGPTADPKDHFGADLQLATSGGQVLVADTTRARVVLLALGGDLAQPPTLLAQFGTTDQPGDDLAHLDQPTLVALNGAQAAVYDRANQRVLKLRVR